MPSPDSSSRTALAQLKPRVSLLRRLVTFAVVVVCGAVLVSSYRATGMDPGLLWNNRGRASEFLFGRRVSQADLDSARVRAERVPDMMATQRAAREIRDEAATSGKTVPREPELSKQIKTRADGYLRELSPAARQAEIEADYRTNVDKLKGGFFPPDMRREKLLQYGGALLETLAIALWGTLLAVVVSVPLSVLAAKRSLEVLASGDGWWHRALRWTSRAVVRRGLDVCRGFNEFVLALLIVAVIGLGPFTGVLALFIHTVGVLGKVFAEAIDAAEPGPVEGVASSGARPVQILSLAVLPQVMPYWVSNSLLRLETNVRSATILGVVGAGGIGFLMSDKINGYQYREACTMMIIVLLTVTLIDVLCTRLMKAVV